MDEYWRLPLFPRLTLDSISPIEQDPYCDVPETTGCVDYRLDNGAYRLFIKASWGWDGSYPLRFTPDWLYEPRQYLQPMDEHIDFPVQGSYGEFGDVTRI